MTEDLASGETIVVAVYSNRHDAEVAKSFLEDQGIYSFVTADDVHVQLQLTEGARLHVMSDRAEAALDRLKDADMLMTEGQRGEHEGDGTADHLVDRPHGSVSRSFTVSFVILVLALIVAMVLFNLT